MKEIKRGIVNGKYRPTRQQIGSGAWDERGIRKKVLERREKGVGQNIPTVKTEERV